MEHALFAMNLVDITGEGSDSIVACAWDGMTYIVDQDQSIVKFKFDDRVCAFAAGMYYSLARPYFLVMIIILILMMVILLSLTLLYSIVLVPITIITSSIYAGMNLAYPSIQDNTPSPQRRQSLALFT